MLQRAIRVMNEGVSILVTGETGSGKEVFARRLHNASRRRAGPFVAINCAALPEALIEAELFGYQEGAFTGARRKGMPGRIREAQGGVLFLDEIADMPVLLQTRLLRVLEERVVSPLGGGPGVAVDFDLVCATHGDLPSLAASGRFRNDLLYRVAGLTVSLPSLFQRADRHALISSLFAELGGEAKQLRLEVAALERLAAYRWPGNVRELRSVLRSLTALAEPGDSISVEDLPTHLSGSQRAADERFASLGSTMPSSLGEVRRNAIDRVLEECGPDVAEAARRLGVHRSTVYRYLARNAL
jgi:transcriptional regulator of acetoin/glycerol metabolism